MTEDLKKTKPVKDVPGQLTFAELAQENEALRKKVRDLQATLDESAANGGTWPV